MASIFLKAYNIACKNSFAQYGFKRSGNNHWRVMNDVFQSFFLNRFSSGNGFTIYFGVVPLCCDMLPIDADYTAYLYNLAYASGKLPGYSYRSNTEEWVHPCMDRLLLDFKNCLIPFFNEAVNCTFAYNAVLKLETQLSAIPDFFVSDSSEEITIAKAFMLLKSDHFEKALEYFQRLKKNSIECVMHNLDAQKMPEAIQEWQGYLQRDTDWWTQRIALIETRDKAKILPWLLENEQKNLMELGLEKEK